MYYKIEYQSPLSRNKIAEERITLLKRGTIIPKFNTVEDLQFIEAVTVTKNNVLETFSIDRHVEGTVEIFGKYVTMTPITTTNATTRLSTRVHRSPHHAMHRTNTHCNRH